MQVVDFIEQTRRNMDLARIRHWVDDADALIAAHLPRYAPLWRSAAISPDQGKVVVCLSTACYTCSGGQLILLEHGRLSEAEILGRSTIEGTLKFMYLLESTSTFEERFDHYAGTLFDFASIKDHFIINDIAQSRGDLEPALRDLLIADEELETAKSSYTKSDRNSIEQRWSVRALVRHLSEKSRKERGEYLRILRAYAMAGHLSHMDFYGIMSMRERDSRPPERAKALNEAQAATLIVNVMLFSVLRLSAALAFAGEPAHNITSVYEETEAALQPLESFIRDWIKSEYSA